MPGDSTLYDVVVIGASAGGIEALSHLMSTLPADFPIPIVVAQHLDPRRTSHLGEILARQSHLPVKTVTETQTLAQGTVYVVPADRDVELNDHEVILLRDGLHHARPSIDRLLSSAARAYGERVIAIILTGTGTDGTAGAHDVKAAGGMVVIENPRTAAYPAMPAALAPSSVDVVADLDQIGPVLTALATGAHVPSEPDQVDNLQLLLDHVRERSGIDFTSYKRHTIVRRLQRRLVATGVTAVPGYREYLDQHPEEYQQLVASFLVKVTEFFRDPAFFDALRTQVLPALIDHARAQSKELRIWSAGCSTGEEAYSVAILVADLLGDELDHVAVRVFGTDLSNEAIAYARQGTYPASALSDVPEELVARYFTKIDGAYEIHKRVRGLTVFGLHDLGERAPFPRIDLVLCRNVLMYFDPALCRRALGLFAYSLRDGGYLALGKAETPDSLGDLLAPVDPHLKLYRRQGPRVLVPSPPGMSNGSSRPITTQRLTSPAFPPRFQVTPGQQVDSNTDSLGEQPRRTTVEQVGNFVLGLPVGVVVVDRKYDVLAINAAAHQLLGIYHPAIGKDLIHLIEALPSATLRGAIDAAFRQHMQGILEQPITVETARGERRELQIACYAQQPDSAGDPQAGRVIVLVTDVTQTIHTRQVAEEASRRSQRDYEAAVARQTRERKQVHARKTTEFEGTIARQHEEIVRLKTQLQQAGTINADLLAANEELTVANLEQRGAYEELQVSREEEQVAAEEVKTLNEELQATNEEMETVNEELEASVEELHTANDDMQARSAELQVMAATLEAQRQTSDAARVRLEAILLSMGDALLVVDETGSTVLTNAAYSRMFGGPATSLAPQDETGKPLPVEDTPQYQAAHSVSFTMTFTLPVPEGRRWFEAHGERIGNDDQPRGGVVAIRDITDRSVRRLQERFIALAAHELRSPLTTVSLSLELVARNIASWGVAVPPLLAIEPESARAHAERYLNLARYQIGRMRVLVGDLLDTGRLQTGKFSLDRVQLDLVHHTRRVVEGVQLTTEKVRIVLEAPGEPVLVMGDATRLEQVLVNLLTNALTYAGTSAQINVRVRQADRWAEMQVEDYGPGIPADDLPHIFTHFYQVTHDALKPKGGLGLGLYIAHEVIAAHDGKITVQSHLGRGTTFTVLLPSVASKRAEVVSPARGTHTPRSSG